MVWVLGVLFVCLFVQVLFKRVELFNYLKQQNFLFLEDALCFYGSVEFIELTQFI